LDLWGLGRSKEYDLQHTKNLRVAPISWNPQRLNAAMQFGNWGVLDCVRLRLPNSSVRKGPRRIGGERDRQRTEIAAHFS
jgi:hypothetical protein